MPSELEWESQKDAIYGLYIKENRKLRDLQEEMRLAGFSATYVVSSFARQHSIS